MATILKSDVVVSHYENRLTQECSKLKGRGITPNLKVILVGENPASLIYTKNKKKFCEKVGALCEIVTLDEKISSETFLSTLKKYATDKNVHGLFVQLPLPKQLASLEFNSLIPFNKDVDGFHPLNLAAIMENADKAKHLFPCTPSGIIKLLDFYKIDVTGKNAVIVGRSLIVGKPLSLMLTNLDATVTLAHSKTKDLKSLTKNADIVVAAIGKAQFLDKSYFRNDQSQIVIDVGINKLNGKTVGDVNFEEVAPMVSAITPVPGGVGPLTILCLIENLFKATLLS